MNDIQPTPPSSPIPPGFRAGLLQGGPNFVKKNIGILIILVFVIGAAAFLANRQTEKPQPKADQPLAEKVECPPLAQGEQLYNVLTDKSNDPQIKQVIFNPLNVKQGETQIITVKVLNRNTDTITDANKVNVMYFTDNSLAAVALTIKRVDNVSGSVETNPDGPDLLTTWKGTWVNNDTACVNYMATITAVNDNGENTVDVSFR